MVLLNPMELYGRRLGQKFVIIDDWILITQTRSRNDIKLDMLM
jgi:hypothetical protein